MRTAHSGGSDGGAVARIILTCAWGALVIISLAVAQHLTGAATTATWIPIDIGPDPLALAGLGCLAAAILSDALGRRPLVAPLLIVPVALVAILFAGAMFGWELSQWDYLTGPGSGAHNLLHPHLATPAADLLLATIATGLALQNGRRSRIASVFLASLLLALAAMSFVMTVTELMEPDAVSKYILMSPAAAVASLLIAIALLALRKESGWPALLVTPDGSGNILRIAFPAVLILPVIMVFVELALDESRLVSRDMAEVVTACVNVAAFAGILLWSVSRVSRSNAQLATTSEALDMAAVMITDLDGIIEHWSAGCERLYGWKQAEAVGQSKYKLLGSHENGVPALPLQPGDASTVQARALLEQRRDDKRITVIEEARLLEAPDTAVRLVLSLTDISKREAALAALRKSETRLELALEAHSIAVFEWDRLENRVTWNSGNEGVLGVPTGQIKTFEDWMTLLEPEDADRMVRIMEKAEANSAAQFGFIYRLNTPDGDQRAIEGSARCIYREDGKLASIIGVSLDVTERVRADRALQERGEQFRSVLENVPSSMLIIDDEGAVLSFSRSAEMLFGYSAGEVVGHHVSLLTQEGPEDTTPDLFTAERARTAGGMRRLITRHRDGREIPVEAWVGEFRTHSSRLFSIFMRDISGRIESEKRLYTLGQELAHAWRVNTMGEITAGIAHELNQPLSATVNFLAAAKRMATGEGPRAQQLKETLESAAGQALRAGQIIRRMRLFASKGEVDMRPLQPAEVIAEAVDLMRFGSMEGVTLHYDLQTDARVLGDRVQVQQVIVNLLRNAAEAMKAQPQAQLQINVSVRECDRDTVEVSVSDSGPGLPQGRLEQTFSPFLTTKEAGMGVGLSICRRIVESHGGRMTAENRSEGGAIVRFTLPIVKEEELV